MSVSIELNNFQVYESAKIEFERGLNIITGFNSSGKSSIVRAFKAVFSNPRGSNYYVRSGEDNAKVTVSISGYDDVSWVRKKSTVGYVVGESEFSKASSIDLLDVYREYPIVKFNGDVLNIIDEWTYPFPFSYRSPAELFQMFELVISSMDYTEFLQLIKSDLDDLRKEKSSVEFKLSLIDNKIEKIDSFYSSESVNVSSLYKDCVALSSVFADAEEVDNLTNVRNLLFIDSLDFSEFLSVGSYFQLKKDLSSIIKLSNFYSVYDSIGEIIEFDLVDFYVDLKSVNSFLEELKSIAINESFDVHKFDELNEKLSGVSACPLCGTKLN